MRSLTLSLAASLVLGLGADAQQPKEKEPRKGERDDAHGSILWVSTAKRSARSDWEYNRTVTNRSETRNCRVTWKVGNASPASTIPPRKTHTFGGAITDIPPDEAPGIITYNGGRQAGQGEADAAAWVPKRAQGKESEKATRTVMGKAEVGFVWGGDVKEFKVAAESTARRTPTKEEDIHYVLTFAPKLPPGVRVLWTPIDSPELRQSRFVEGGTIRFLRLNPDRGAFKATITSSRPVQLHDGTLQFLSERNEVLAEAWLPALAPPPAPRKKGAQGP